MKRAPDRINVVLFALPILLLDIAVLPVSPLYSVPFSMLLVAYFLVRYAKRRAFERRYSIYIFTGCLLISTVFSFLLKEAYIGIDNTVDAYNIINVHKEDLKRFIYLLIALCVYRVAVLLYREHREESERSVKKVLIFVCLVYVAFAIVFKANIVLFYQLKGLFFNMNVNMLSNEVLQAAGYLSRYSFIFLDPNNGNYYILIILIFLLENFPLKLWAKIGIWILGLASVFLSMSTGGLYTVVLYIGAKSVIAIYNAFKNKVDNRIIVLLSAAVALAASAVIIDLFTGGRLVNFFFASQAKVIERWSSNSMSGRFDKYIYLLSQGLPPLIGNGYVIIREGLYFTPHSDHFRFMYSYGLIAYGALMISVIKRRIFRREYLFLIPAFVTFSINSLIDEPRMLYTFVILLAVANTKFGPVSQQEKVTDAVKEPVIPAGA